MIFKRYMCPVFVLSLIFWGACDLSDDSPSAANTNRIVCNPSGGTPPRVPSKQWADELVAWFKTRPIAYRLVAGTANIWTRDNVVTQKIIFNDQLKNDDGSITTIMDQATNHLINPNVAKVLGFYEKNNHGGAFANTFAALRDFEFSGEKTEFLEYFFQAQKIFNFSYENADKKTAFPDYCSAFKKTQSLKTGGWGDFPNSVKAFMKTNEKKSDWWKDWDKQSLGYMAKIHSDRFKYEPELFLALLATPYGSIIVEDSPWDGTWGRGNVFGAANPNTKSNKMNYTKGKNQLGLLYATHRERFWKDFKINNQKANFNPKDADHVLYMLKWLKDYDGWVKDGIL